MNWSPTSRSIPSSHSNTRQGSRRSATVMAGFLISGAIFGNALAQEPTPNTFTDVPVPQLTGWNEVNYLNVEPGVDGYSGASARTQIYTSALAKQNAADALANDAPDLEDALWTGSPAAIYYSLDDGSGRAPGLQVVTDDLAFPTNNCIMSSGERIDEELGTLVPKTCSDPQGSAKRYFLEIREADTPVDLVFDTGMKDIRYKGVKDPADDGGEELAAFKEEYGIGRIYRVIQKVVNNSDERWLGIRMELGHGVGNNFVPFNAAEDGVAFELREAVPREFFEGETGAPDIAVWNPDRFATFSPKAFDDGSRERFDPGFFDAQAAGHFPPQNVGNGSDKTTLIFSGDEFNEIGSYGAITDNHFSMADTQAAGTGFDDGTTQGIFGYMLSDSLAPHVIARYDEGDPDGESSAIEAWWDGSNWRYGQAGGEDVDFGTVAPFGVVSPGQLELWAEDLLGTPITDTDKVRYSSDLADDLATQNMDTFIYISDGILDENGDPKYENITLRVTAVSTASAGLSSTSVGNGTPAWAEGGSGEMAPELATYRAPRPAPEALNDSAQAVGVFPVEIDLMENDVLNGALLSQRIADGDVTAEYTVVGNPANGTVSVNATDGQATYTANSGFAGSDTFTYEVTVTDANAGDSDDYDTDPVSNTATVTIDVVPYPEDDAPIAKNDSAVTFINTPVTIDVLDNDLRADSGTLALDNDPLNGSAVIADGKVVYTPAAGYTGLDRFSYTVEANGDVSNTAVITVRVDEPVAAEDDSSSEGDGPVLGCSYNPGAPFDPTLPLATLAAIAGLAVRSRRKQVLQ